MARTTPVVPGFVTVGGAGEALRLAPRSVRDLIYSGRLPSVRLGRLHFVSAADLEVERRRRLGLALPRPRVSRPKGPRASSAVAAAPVSAVTRRSRATPDPAARARRAEERAAAMRQWLAAAHRAPMPLELPLRPETAQAQASCGVCGRNLRPGERVFVDVGQQQPPTVVCARCGRRALLAWADQRAREATAARQLARGDTEGETARAA